LFVDYGLAFFFFFSFLFLPLLEGRKKSNNQWKREKYGPLQATILKVAYHDGHLRSLGRLGDEGEVLEEDVG
jgi:hypothetical protein